GGRDDRLRRRRERHRPARVGRLRDRGRERARRSAAPRRPRLPVGGRGGRRPGHRATPRLPRMIDARAARAAPGEFRRNLPRNGAEEAFDAWLAADGRWRELVPQVDDLRARTKTKGKPTPEQLEELRRLKDELQRVEAELAEAEAARDEAFALVPNPPDDSAP